MDVELALKINRLVHNECKDVQHDIGLRIEELVRLHQGEEKERLIKFFTWLNDFEELKYTEKGIEFYVSEYLKSTT
jgi:hypothetical protein